MTKSTFLVSRTFIFDAAHKLVDYPGKCANLHGHRYELTVTCQCVQDEDGIDLDFMKLKSYVEENIIEALDHHYLNDIIDMPNPTAENILLWVYGRLVPKLDSIGWLYSLELKEGRDTKITLYRNMVGYVGGTEDD